MPNRLINPRWPALLLTVLPVLSQEFAATDAPPRNWVALALSGDGSRALAAASYGGLYVSTNSGVSWQPSRTTPGFEPQRPWTALASSANGLLLVAVADSNPILVSRDGGDTWTSTGPVGPWTAVICSADATRIVAAEYGRGISVSTDFGVTWISAGAPAKRWRGLAGSSDGMRLAAVAEPGPGYDQQGGIWLSADGGTTWSPSTAPDRAYQSVACAQDGGILGAAAGDGQIWLSNDHGVTWTEAAAPNGQWADLACSTDGTKWYAADGGGGLWTSADSGQTWQAAAAPAAQWQAVACTANGDEALAGVWNSWPEEPFGIYRLETPAAVFSLPSLAIAFSGDHAIISWPASADGFVLQQSPFPASESWQPVNVVPTVQNGQYQITLPITNGQRVYRLAK